VERRVLVDLVWYLLILGLVAIVAGFVGSLTGIGGGIVIIPVLIIFFNVPLIVAIGASVITILANSATTGSAYIRDHLTDLRIGMFLEIATVPGAIIGATLTVVLIHGGLAQALVIALGVLLVIIAISGFLRHHPAFVTEFHPDARSRRLGFRGDYHDAHLGHPIHYEAENTNSALGIMFGAGLVSGMFGIGSGVLKVFALDDALKLPIKVSTATSNFMIGVTACAGAGILLMAGYVNALIAAPMAIGATAGAFAGSLLLPGLASRTVRIAFLLVVLGLAIELIVRGVGGP